MYRLAQRFQLCGWVQNTSVGVEIEVEGNPEAIACFQQAGVNDGPKLRGYRRPKTAR